MTSKTSPTSTRKKKTLRIATIGVAGVGLTVAGAGVAVAATPSSGVAHAVKSAAHSVGIDWGQLPPGYTKAQYEAFWGAGYSGEDLTKLEAVWNLDATHTKARAGQLLLEHKALPFEPGANTAPAPSADEASQYEAALGAGYTADDITKLEAVWHTDFLPTKAHLGQLLLAGQDVPVKPSGTDQVNAPAQTLTPAQQKAAALKSGK